MEPNFSAIEMAPALPPAGSSSALAFDPETHTYRKDGLVIPGVSEVLGSVGIIERTWFNDVAAWRGSVVHACCQLDDEGTLDEETVAEEARPRLAAWRRFKSETGFVAMHIEKPEYGKGVWGLYAGTPDRVGVFPNHQGKPAIVDLKSGVIEDWHALQLGAYTNFYANANRRICVRLKPDGTYAVREFPIHERRNDVAIFLAALAVHQWKRNGK